MSKTIAQLKSEVNSTLNQLAVQYGGENVDISGDPEKMDHVSRSVDSKNEIWNENLPTRPNS